MHMTAPHSRLLLSALVLGIALSGCSLLSKPLSINRDKEKAQAAAAAPAAEELTALRAENAQLRQEQADLRASLTQMEQRLNDRMAEQRRFQDMMATNFDMLEQSIAMSLKRERAPAAQPAAPPARATADTPQPQTAPRSVAPPAPMPSAAPAPAPVHTGAAPRQDAPPARDMAQAAPVAAAVTAAGEDDLPTPENIGDRDLRPPANPRLLTPHREAKPLYDKGFAAFAGQDYGTAIQHFQDFLARFPDDIYSDNAQFWIAESHFRQGQWDEAEEGYRRVLRNYEHRSTLEGYKTPDAIYRIGQTHLKRNNPRQAAYYFANVAERWSGSSAGRKAQQEMSAIVANTAQAGN
jgi:tol-pal system protein YbgF